jgi:cytochrome c oxidase cbb3-type subunit III
LLKTVIDKLLVRRAVLPCAFVLLASFLPAQTPPKFDQASVARGQQIFIANCGFCHGPRATGGEKGPDLLRSVLVLHDDGGQSIGQVIQNGRPDKGMPKFSMTPQQIADIATFLHSSVAAAANRDDYKVLNIVTGDAKAGESYFNGPGHCTSCHSVTGDLKGIGARYEPLALQDRIVMPRERGPNEKGEPLKPFVTFTVSTSKGESLSGVPVNFDDFNVALIDAAGDYHSFVRENENNPHIEIHNRLAAHLEMLTKYKDSDIHNLTAYLVTLK